MSHSHVIIRGQGDDFALAVITGAIKQAPTHFIKLLQHISRTVTGNFIYGYPNFKRIEVTQLHDIIPSIEFGLTILVK